MAIASRVAKTPDTAMALLRDVWGRVLGPTRALIAELQNVADGEGAHFQLAPWDCLYYTEQLRRKRFGLDSEAAKPYLQLNAVMNAMFWEAGRVLELSFKEIPAAADIAEAFTSSPGGLYDAVIAKRWRSTILSAGDTVPMEDAFRNFRGRDPDPGALLRRFGLEQCAGIPSITEGVAELQSR